MRIIILISNPITRKGKKCTNLVIESVDEASKRRFYYEKSALGKKSRNRKCRYNKNKLKLLDNFQQKY